MRRLGWFAAVTVGVAVALAVIGSAGDSSARAPAERDRGKLILDDEFNGSTLDRSRWATCYWWSQSGCTNGSTGELQWYRDDNVRVADGQLQLEARRERVVDSDGHTRDYTSGIVSGAGYKRNLFTFTYGYVEAQMWIPAGTGLWSAFWMLPASRAALPEVDIMEVVGESPGTVVLHTHWAAKHGTEVQSGKTVDVGDLSNGWHTFAIDWQPDSLTWFIDGAEKWRVTDPAQIPHEPMYLLANLAVGGAFTKTPTPSTPFPSQLRVDAVRVWQKR